MSRQANAVEGPLYPDDHSFEFEGVQLQLRHTTANKTGALAPEDDFMQDLIFTLITIAFFALSLAYVHFCDRVG